MGKFSKIKKYNLKSLSIDKKIKFLDKELERTGLNEQPANSTAGVYVGSKTNTNQQYAEFTAKNFNGYGFGFSGDSNLGQGNIGGAGIRASDGAALSPPHPVTGERITTGTKGSIGIGGSKLAIPGERRTPSSRMTGPILWYFDSNANNPDGTQGAWRSLEYNSPEVHGNAPFPNYQAGFGYWGSGAFGLVLRSDGEAFASLFAALNDSEGNQFNPDNLSNPETVVLTKDRVDDSSFLPIDVAKRFIAGSLDLAGEGFEFLKGKGKEAIKPLETRFGGIKAVLDALPAFLNFLAHQVNPNSPWTEENPFPVDIGDKQKDAIKNDIEELFNEWGDERVDELNDGAPMTNKEQSQLNDTINRDKSNKDDDNLVGDIFDAEYPSSRMTLNNVGNPKAFKGNVETKKDGSKTPIAIDDNYVFEGDMDASAPSAPEIIKRLIDNPRVQEAIKKSGLDYPYRKDASYEPDIDLGGGVKGKEHILNKNMPIKFNLTTRSTFRESLNESVKLGHFDPEALTVNIEDIRKGIMPEFPEKPPAEMIDGYSVKSKLAPKVIKGEPTIKVTKKDLASLHILKDSEIKELLQQIDLINAHLQNNPADLIYAQQRYPKNDIRLAQLNWKMDQMLKSGEEYLDTQFPENQRLVDRIKKATKKTMELTNPEAYKNLNKPDMELMSLDDHMKEKRVVSRHFKKKRQSKSMFRVNMEKVKEKNRKVAEQKVAEWQEKRRIELLNSNEFDELKSDWKKELENS